MSIQEILKNESIQYVVTKFSKNDTCLDIEGRELTYVQLGDTHHGCQCNLSGGDENHKKITENLKKICDLFKEINELNKRK